MTWEHIAMTVMAVAIVGLVLLSRWALTVAKEFGQMCLDAQAGHIKAMDDLIDARWQLLAARAKSEGQA